MIVKYLGENHKNNLKIIHHNTSTPKFDVLIPRNTVIL
jgi:hypothetical protein